MANFRVQIGGDIYEAPGNEIPELLKNKGAKVIGLAPITTPQQLEQELTVGKGNPTIMNLQNKAREFIKSDSFPPLAGAAVAGAFTGGMGVLPALAIEGAGAGIGTLAGQAQRISSGKDESFNPLEAGKQAAYGAMGGAGGRIVGAGLKAMAPEMKRIGPGIAHMLGGVKEKAAELLANNPEEAYRLAMEGEKGAAREAFAYAGQAAKKLKDALIASNTKLKTLQEMIIKETGGKPVVSIVTAEAKALEKANEYGLIGESLDPKSTVAVKRLMRVGRSKVNELGRASFEGVNNLRVQLNNLMYKSDVSPQLKAIYSTYKSALDEAIDAAVPGNLGGQYRQILDEQSGLRGYAQDLFPVLKAKNAPDQIVGHLEKATDIGAKLEKFDQEIGGGALAKVKNAVEAKSLGNNVLKNPTAGASSTNVLKAPGLMSHIPYAGRLFSPQSMTRLAVGVSRLPESQLPLSRALFQKKSQNLFSGDQR